MQTFLPYDNFHDSARVLDRQRLGKQRVETWQILRALTGESKGWVNHPATKMWRGHEYALAVYGAVMCQEWIDRGYKDTLKERFIRFMVDAPFTNITAPALLGVEAFHVSHQSNLLRKDPEHYSQYFTGVPDDLPYLWELPTTSQEH